MREKDIPTTEEFLLETPLYSSYRIGPWNYKKVLEIEFFPGTLDTHCAECGKASVFVVRKAQLPFVGDLPHMRQAQSLEELLNDPHPHFPTEGDRLQTQPIDEYAAKDRVFILQFECTRSPQHTLLFLCQVQNSKIQKIGQYPSLADLADSEIRKYRKVLGEDRYRELNRAVGLSAHGIGIGAYVYLRRIFESLIEDAHTVAAQTPDWDEETFQKSHMDEKIGLLADYLPQYLVENISIYSILSKGIHSLTEEECLDNFELLRVSIELILDQKIEQEERDKKISRTKNALDTLKGKLRSS